jgi:hypothetical protein
MLPPRPRGAETCLIRVASRSSQHSPEPEGSKPGGSRSDRSTPDSTPGVPGLTEVRPANNREGNWGLIPRTGRPRGLLGSRHEPKSSIRRRTDPRHPCGLPVRRVRFDLARHQGCDTDFVGSGRHGGCGAATRDRHRDLLEHPVPDLDRQAGGNGRRRARRTLAPRNLRTPSAGEDLPRRVVDQRRRRLVGPRGLLVRRRRGDRGASEVHVTESDRRDRSTPLVTTTPS